MTTFHLIHVVSRQRLMLTSHTTALLLLLLCIVTTMSFVLSAPSLKAAADISQVTNRLPTMFFPEDCATTSISGLYEGLVSSQRSDRYQSDFACSADLIIRGLTYHAIKFTFHYMNLPEKSHGDCEDYVQFFVTDASSPALTSEITSAARYAISQPLCGTTVPSEFVSNDTNVIVTFKTNGFRQATGFRFKFERVSMQRTEKQYTSVDAGGQICSPGRGCVKIPAQRSAVSSRGVGPLTAVGLIVLGFLVALSQFPYMRHSLQRRLLLKTTDR